MQEVRMVYNYDWSSFYAGAVLESDQRRLSERFLNDWFEARTRRISTYGISTALSGTKEFDEAGDQSGQVRFWVVKYRLIWADCFEVSIRLRLILRSTQTGSPG